MSDLHSSYQQYLELQQQIKALQEKATLLMMEGRNKAINDIKALLAAYEIRADELGFPAPPAPPKRDRKAERRRDRSIKGTPKYRDPESGATWTGAGRVPNWIIGKNYDDFLIERTTREEPPLSPPAQYQPAPSPAVDATHAVTHMVSGHMPQPAAAWPSGAPGLAQQK